MEAAILDALLQQSPMIVFMGVVVWWLQKRYVDSEKEKSDLAKDVIKITYLWEQKYSKEDVKSQKIFELLSDIRERLREYGNN